MRRFKGEIENVTKNGVFGKRAQAWKCAGAFVASCRCCHCCCAADALPLPLLPSLGIAHSKEFPAKSSRMCLLPGLWPAMPALALPRHPSCLRRRRVQIAQLCLVVPCQSAQGMRPTPPSVPGWPTLAPGPPCRRLGEHAALTAGGSLQAATTLCVGAARLAVHLDGGRHHARKASASGFCFVNDVVGPSALPAQAVC